MKWIEKRVLNNNARIRDVNYIEMLDDILRNNTLRKVMKWWKYMDNLGNKDLKPECNNQSYNKTGMINRQDHSPIMHV